MIGMKMTDMKASFFDKPKIVNSMNAATRRVLSKFGAYVRTGARSSIRKRKRSSAPGSPPSSHAGLLKQFIYFAYDPSAQNVVIGPTRLNGKAGEAPESLEYGGETTIERFRRGKRTVKRVSIEPRPFMHPAFEKEKTKLPAMWANSLK
jgi:hypothetical protein